MINEAIGSQNFELIRDRIGEILANELNNQATLKSDESLNSDNLTVWTERFIPFDKEELPAINVALSSGDYSGETPVTADGSYLYTIDIFTKAKTKKNGTSLELGDKKSSLQCQMITGLCRSILMNSLYLTLGFERGYIHRRKINSLNVAQLKEQEGIYPFMIRLEMTVKVTETTIEELPTDAAGYDSVFTINETDKGFKFTINN